MKKFILFVGLFTSIILTWTYFVVPSRDVRDILPQTAVPGETNIKTFHRLGVQMSECDMLRIRIRNGKAFYSIDAEPWNYPSLEASIQGAHVWFKRLHCRENQPTHIRDFP